MLESNIAQVLSPCDKTTFYRRLPKKASFVFELFNQVSLLDMTSFLHGLAFLSEKASCMIYEAFASCVEAHFDLSQRATTCLLLSHIPV